MDFRFASLYMTLVLLVVGSAACNEGSPLNNDSPGIFDFEQSAAEFDPYAKTDGDDDDDDDDGPGEEIVICHTEPRVPNALPHTVRIDASDLDEHLSHGDTPGSCQTGTRCVLPGLQSAGAQRKPGH